ncbi:MAG: DNA polymerase III subunit delta' [Candidatus Omnitrophica bacterium]|nr:DNA polymerase III subunit delta' [Candidatus Omnitrophota bacterium]
MSFEDIKGQDKALRRIRNYMASGHLAGAYLFCGPEGVGKSLAAKTFAKALNCLNGEFDSCDSCASCSKIDKNQHPDVHIINSGEPVLGALEVKSDKTDSGSSEIKIEEVRGLQSEINLRPYEGRKKVFIIQDAHNLNADASNAFLKTLEEPPKDSVIILVSQKPSLIFKTIISRCQVVKFAYLKRKELQDILSRELKLDDNSVHFLAYFSEGSLGHALSLNKRAIMLEKNRIIDSFLSSAGTSLEGTAKQKRELVRDNLNILASWFRDIYLIKAGIQDSEVINIDRRQELRDSVDRYSFPELDRILNSISASLSYLDKNVNVKLILSNLRQALGN